MLDSLTHFRPSRASKELPKSCHSFIRAKVPRRRTPPAVSLAAVIGASRMGEMSEAEAQLQSFIDKFDEDNQALIRGLRAALLLRLPSCAELVWDNYNFFVIGYSPTERPSDYIVSIAASASGASLSFNRGAELNDPKQVLKGESKVNRFIRLPTSETLLESDVDEMIEQACRLSDVPLP